ncbi:MAG: mRNA-binding ribosome synthesis protein nop7 [Watsoniomyces obsoletus]|nr:MAG: mRNA-binding ribosome synthesis protein nop7 [Watsoniomyces obsoletus]
MGKIKKKGTSGQAKNFITRTQAVRKLQITLPDFRRLCIFKGIYPREPGNKKKASKSSTPSTTFYYTRDIQYLLHEPLLRKFREHKAFAKKIRKALGRNEVSDAARLERIHKPRLSLDHIIKERYPTFVDALRDLDDALSTLFLFANLPSTVAVPNKTIALCQRLCLEFQHYLIVSHSLRKSFLSIKGIYYQATIQGQDILWLVPYQFVQRMTGDIDFRIMGTFVQFYTTLLGFVNFRLYTSIGLVYPPKFNASSDERGGELRAFTLEGKPISTEIAQVDETRETSNIATVETNGDASNIQNGSRTTEDIESVVKQIAAAEEPHDVTNTEENVEVENIQDGAIDVFDAPISADADILTQPGPSADTAGSLFAPFTFFLSRETPRAPLEFLLRSFGCNRIGWDLVSGDGAYTNSESDASITHQVVDRPPQPVETVIEPDSDMEDDGEAGPQPRVIPPRTKIPGRIYVQPQWVWDCINEGKLLRPDLYAPGAELPPHLSPWVKPGRGQYDPTVPLVEQEREGEAEEEVENEEAEEDETMIGTNGTALQSVREKQARLGAFPADEEDEGDDDNGMQVALDESSEDDDQEAETEEVEESKPTEEEKPQEEDEWGGFESESENEDTIHQLELEAEAAGLPPPNRSSSQASQRRKAAAKKRRAEEEELERQRMMMSRKKRKTLDKVLHSRRKTDEEALKLRTKKRRIEKGRNGVSAS